MEYNYQQTAPERCVKAMKKSGKLVIAVVGILAGALLMFVGNRVGRTESLAIQETPTAPAETRSVEAYRADLEARMESICAQVAGVGAVDVVVTLEGGYEYVYATDKRVTSSGETVSYITVGSGEGKTLVYVTERAPAITGIGVVCTGGTDANVRREVTSLLSAAFGVGSNKIYVTQRK
ncbi:MAG: hypothetical protein IKU90_03800 [Clostridia bacterium]|nr:hypothetical protein [Clostridia bacterium]